jgi:CRISPR-associated protein Cas2
LNPSLAAASYDVPSDRSSTKIAALLKDFGERVQYSVFECLLEDAALARLRTKL